MLRDDAWCVGVSEVTGYGEPEPAWALNRAADVAAPLGRLGDDAQLSDIARQIACLDQRLSGLQPDSGNAAADALLRQFKTVTFAFSAWLTGRLARGPVDGEMHHLESLAERFAEVASGLAPHVARPGGPGSHGEEVGAAAQAVALKLVVLLDRYYGRQDDEVLDQLNAMIARLCHLADHPCGTLDDRSDEELATLSRRFDVLLALFGQALERRKLPAGIVRRYQTAAYRAERALDKLIAVTSVDSQAKLKGLQVKLAFAGARLAASA